MEATADRVDGVWITHFGGKDHGRRTFMRTYPAASASAGGSRGVIVQGTVPVLASAPVRPVAPALRPVVVRPAMNAAAAVPAQAPDVIQTWREALALQREAAPKASEAEAVALLARRCPKLRAEFLKARALLALEEAAKLPGPSRAVRVYQLSLKDPGLVADLNEARRRGVA